MNRIIALLFISILISCNPQETDKTTRLEGFVFGTSYHITYVSNQQSDFQKSIDSLFYLVNKSLSTYLPTSDISKINAGDTSVVVDERFREVFHKSKRIHQETNGYFDPTVGNLVNAWGFGPNEPQKELDSIAVQEMMDLVGFNKVQLVQQQIVKDNPKIF
ncbi:MAG: FAD:protein FMN transferase, partial [Flavobacteriaceae bacterium]|nr:FAD:protein FMN transferase [Flavobacteriaceae bacterium]